MTVTKFIIVTILGQLILSCKGTTQLKVKDVKLTELKNETKVPLPPVPTGLKVSAYLIFKDSTISTFDVLNDKTIALWNTIIGAGDALKPSDKTRVRLTGKLDGLNVTIYNGKHKVINQKLPDFSGDYEFVINDTGCDEVKVVVTKIEKIVYQDKIPFRCGE